MGAAQLSRAQVIDNYDSQLVELTNLRGEWAEIKKAQVRQEAEAFRYSKSDTITERRNEARFVTLDASTELIDLEFKIKTAEDYCLFYRTLLGTLE